MNEKKWKDGLCPYCGSNKITRTNVEKIYLTEYHEYSCSDCNKRFTENYEPTRVMNPDMDDKEYFDVEIDYGSCKNRGFYRYVKSASWTSIIGILTLLQMTYTVMLGNGWVESKLFTVEHEDIISMMHLMTFFIVATIEKE